MSLDFHTVSANPAGAQPWMSDRVGLGIFRDVAFPASAASVTVLGSITAGSGFDVLPTIAPTGGTLTAGVSPSDPAVVVATSLKCVTASVAAPGSGVAINDTFNPAGGALAKAGPYGNGSTTPPAATLLTVSGIEVVSAVVNAGGSGGTNGAVTITGTTGTGTKFQATGTISGNALTGPLTVTVAGAYTVGPTSLTSEPVTGGSLSGATVTLVMGAEAFTITTAGGYTAAPAATNNLANGATGSGTGVQATLSYGLGTAQIAHSGNYSGAPSWTVTATDGNGTGASIATGTLGGNGNTIMRQINGQFPGACAVVGDLNNQAGDIGAWLKSDLGVSVGLTPPTASTTLTTGTFDVITIG